MLFYFLPIAILGFLVSAAEASQHVRKRLDNKEGNVINAKYLNLASLVDPDVLARLDYRQLGHGGGSKSRHGSADSAVFHTGVVDESLSMSMKTEMSMSMSMKLEMSMSMSMPTSVRTGIVGLDGFKLN
jgi:hypothetical protein